MKMTVARDTQKVDVLALYRPNNRGIIPRHKPYRLEVTWCSENVMTMLRAGESLRKIAWYVQERAGELTNVKRESVIRSLRRLRKAMANGRNLSQWEVGEAKARRRDLPPIPVALWETYDKANARYRDIDVDSPLGELRALQALLQVFSARLQILFAAEWKLKKILLRTHWELCVFRWTVVQCWKMKERLGIIKIPKPKRYRISTR